jgi:phosphate starvation-inducible PhoH-like protein
MIERPIKIKHDKITDAVMLFGPSDSNLHSIEKAYGVSVILRNDEILIDGEKAEPAAAVIYDLIKLISDGEILDEQKRDYVLSLHENGQTYEGDNHKTSAIAFTHKGKPISPKTSGQGDYVNAIKKSEMVFGIGPAGTGKTYLAVAMAVNAYKNKEVERIILARPAVEAGERLGFLPGDLQEKVDPYLHPLLDALYEIMGHDTVSRLREKETIEVVPLAYMRGRTLHNSFIILDEAQNATRSQMKMFLTRMGLGSKVVITGDVTQIDLPANGESGLLHSVDVLKDVEGIAFCRLSERDVVRHSLVRKIIVAYERAEK